MSISAIIFIALGVLIVASLPVWKHSRMWGGGYTPTVFIGAMMAAHAYTVVFGK